NVLPGKASLLHFDNVDVDAVGAGLEVRRATAVSVSHVAVKREVPAVPANGRFRRGVEVLAAPRVRPRQTVHLVAVVVRVDPGHHDLILVQQPRARTRRYIVRRVAKPFRARSAYVEKRQTNPRLLRVSAIANVPTRRIVQQARRGRCVVNLTYVQSPATRTRVAESRGVVGVA